ncbi:hypothetical protein ACG7TL_005875 [Trametes sanguinea]
MTNPPSVTTPHDTVYIFGTTRVSHRVSWRAPIRASIATTCTDANEEEVDTSGFLRYDDFGIRQRPHSGDGLGILLNCSSEELRSPRKRRRVRHLRYKLHRALVQAWKRVASSLRKPRRSDDGVLDEFVLVEWDPFSAP